MFKRLRALVESKVFGSLILVVIGINSLVFALQTSADVVATCGSVLDWVDRICLMVFTVELALKLTVYRRRFFSDWWNIFDFIVVGISYIPDCGMLSALRIFRVLRVFKVISGVRQMRVILEAILQAVPGIAWSAGVMLLIYFVYGILGTNLFGKAFPDWFGTLPRTLYSLFQIMTLESWSMGIARPVAAVYPGAWIYFISYILCSTFIILNVVVGIILNSISDSSRRPIHYEFKNHGVILGWGFQGVPAVMAMFDVWGVQQVVVFTERPVDEVRTAIANDLDKDLMKRVFVYSGTLGNPVALDELYPEKARVIVVLGNGSSDNNDGGNLRVGKIVRQKIDSEFAKQPPKPGARPIQLFIDIACPYNLATVEMYPSEAIQVPEGLEIHIINFYKSTVRELYSSFSQRANRNVSRRCGLYETPYLPLAFRHDERVTHVHLIIAGIGNMAKTLVMELAPLICSGRESGVITVFSSNREELDRFSSAYAFEKLQGVKVELIPTDIDSKSSRARLAEIVRDESACVTVFITDACADKALATVNRLPGELRLENVRLLIEQRILAKWAHGIYPLKLRGFRYVAYFGFTDRYFTSLSERFVLSERALAGEKAGSARERFFMESFVDGLMENLQLNGYGFEYCPNGDRSPVLSVPDEKVESMCRFEHLRSANFSLLRGISAGAVKNDIFLVSDEIVPWDSAPSALKERALARINKALVAINDMYNCGAYPYIVEKRELRRIVGVLPDEKIEESIAERKLIRKSCVLPECKASIYRTREGEPKSEKSLAMVMTPGKGVSRLAYQLSLMEDIPMILVLPSPREEFLASVKASERPEFERWIRNADRIIVDGGDPEKTIRSLSDSVMVKKDGLWTLDPGSRHTVVS